ncbi:hypothetical protein MMC10_002787 [Thelotrema lepadinum]|nr:hypothetical protein [Thelotrema lepadinum]
MTLVISAAANALVSGQFGVNEIASALTIGRHVGSIFSRNQDAKILDIVAELNRLEMQELPDWLTTIGFTRRATIYGDRMRRVTAHNVLDDVEMDTVEGVATFVALILRFIQTPESVSHIIAQLLRGRFEILTCAGGYTEAPLPYSMKGNIVKFIKAVWESDKESDQNSNCLQWLSELTSYVGQSHDPRTHSSYSKAEQERFIGFLLAARRPNRQTPTTFHTLSAGAATVALAARAQGALVQLECMMAAGESTIEAKQLPIASSHAASLIVKLWLVQPPPDIRDDIPGLNNFTQAPNQSMTPPVIVYGGAAEISQHVAKQLSVDAKLKPHQCLRIWEEGVSIGEQAVWCPARSHSRRGCLELAAHSIRKFDEANQNNSMFTTIAIAVGCIKSQFSDHKNRNALQSFAWALDIRRSDIVDFLGFVCHGSPFSQTYRGISSGQLLALAGSIWGGSFDSNMRNLHPDTIGLVCPHGTFLLDIVCSPEDFVNQIIRKGARPLFSFFKGSVPLLPQSSTNGYIVGGSPSASRHRVNLESFFKGSRRWEKPAEHQAGSPIITLETMSTSALYLSAILCAWFHGEVLAELNPATIFENLLKQPEDYDWIQMRHLLGYREVPCGLLVESKFFRLDGPYRYLYVVRTEPRWEWRILIAGIAPPYVDVVDTRYISPETLARINRDIAGLKSTDRSDTVLAASTTPTTWLVLLDKTN